MLAEMFTDCPLNMMYEDVPLVLIYLELMPVIASVPTVTLVAYNVVVLVFADELLTCVVSLLTTVTVNV